MPGQLPKAALQKVPVFTHRPPTHLSSLTNCPGVVSSGMQQQPPMKAVRVSPSLHTGAGQAAHCVRTPLHSTYPRCAAAQLRSTAVHDEAVHDTGASGAQLAVQVAIAPSPPLPRSSSAARPSPAESCETPFFASLSSRRISSSPFVPLIGSGTSTAHPAIASHSEAIDKSVAS